MARFDYKVTIEGKGRLWKPRVVLETTKIVMKRKSGGKKWESDATATEVEGKLRVFIEISATNYTQWSVTVTNVTNNKPVLQKSGSTGSDPNFGNISIIDEEVNPT